MHFSQIDGYAIRGYEVGTYDDKDAYAFLGFVRIRGGKAEIGPFHGTINHRLRREIEEGLRERGVTDVEWSRGDDRQKSRRL